jgi:hypothetical protein
MQLRTLIWRGIFQPGAEYFSLARDTDGWQLRGNVAAVMGGQPTHVQYIVACDAAWRTRTVDIQVETGRQDRSLHLRANGLGQWWERDAERPELAGCIDVDLVASASTNTLPIRRLGLAIGESRDLHMAWVRFPELQVVRSEQTYTRLADRTYRYRNGTFEADLEVDDLGLVVVYPGYCERIAWLDVPLSTPLTESLR